MFWFRFWFFLGLDLGFSLLILNSYLYKDANGILILYSDKNTGDDDVKNDNFRFSFEKENDEIDSKTRINTTNENLKYIGIRIYHLHGVFLQQVNG